MNEHCAVQLLAETKSIFDKHNITYWLDAGTLLGAVRNGRFIPWDRDMDLGTWHENIPKLTSISNEFREKGFEVLLDEHRDEFIIKAEKSKLDVFLYSLINKRATHPLFITRNWIGANLESLEFRLSINMEAHNSEEKTCLKTRLKRPMFGMIQTLPNLVKKKLERICFFLYSKIGSQRFFYNVPNGYFTNLSTINFYGMRFNIPNKVNEYLTLRYGERWAIPNRNWIYYKDVPVLALKGESMMLRNNQSRDA